MRVKIFAEERPAQKTFNYQVELDTDTILKVTALVCSTIVVANLLSLLKD